MIGMSAPRAKPAIRILPASDGFRKVRRDHASETAEDYVEAIASIIDGRGACRVADLARLMRVSHVTVVKTVEGAAQRVALYLDRSGWSEIVGTVSGDDTIFIATRNGGAQRRLLARLKPLLEREGA